MFLQAYSSSRVFLIKKLLIRVDPHPGKDEELRKNSSSRVFLIQKLLKRQRDE